MRPDGALSFPLAGDQVAEGHTVDELRKTLAEKLKKFVPDPVVTVAVKALGGNRIYVVGAAARPGDFPFSRALDVMQSLSLAGARPRSPTSTISASCAGVRTASRSSSRSSTTRSHVVAISSRTFCCRRAIRWWCREDWPAPHARCCRWRRVTAGLASGSSLAAEWTMTPSANLLTQAQQNPRLAVDDRLQARRVERSRPDGRSRHAAANRAHDAERQPARPRLPLRQQQQPRSRRRGARYHLRLGRRERVVGLRT